MKIIFKVFVVLITILLGGLLLRFVFSYFTYGINEPLLDELSGRIHYLKRVDDDLAIFTSSAALTDETLIYHHRDSDVNNNILSFSYDSSEQSYRFIAMDRGRWTEFKLIDGNLSKQSTTKALSTQYLSQNIISETIYEEEGSIYRDGIVIKKFYGIYDDKFTGYRVQGVSPDGRYLIYTSSGYLTPYGYLLGSFLPVLNNENVFIMDLTTLKSTYYVKSKSIQWEQ